MERQPKYPTELIPAADQSEMTIKRAEYDNYIALQARVDVLKDYIENDTYTSVDVIRVMLGIDKTS